MSVLRAGDNPPSATVRTSVLIQPEAVAFRATGFAGLRFQPGQEGSIFIRHITNKSTSLYRFCVEGESCMGSREVDDISGYIVSRWILWLSSPSCPVPVQRIRGTVAFLSLPGGNIGMDSPRTLSPECVNTCAACLFCRHGGIIGKGGHTRTPGVPLLHNSRIPPGSFAEDGKPSFPPR